MHEITVGNSGFIKELNANTIFNLIYNHAPISRKEIADSTQYSAATVSNHVKGLIEAGFVLETTRPGSRLGRRPIYLTINPDRGYILTVDIEVSRYKVVLFNMRRNVVAKSVSPLANSEPSSVMEGVLDEIHSMLRHLDVPLKKVIGVGVAAPGMINSDQGTLTFAPNLGWRDVPLVRLFEERLGVPVCLENEARAAAIGEREKVYPWATDLIYVAINEGIGCGIISQGNLFRGASGNAGEFGHMIIDRLGPQCHCGNRGCWETIASQLALRRRMGEVFGVSPNEIDLAQLAANEPRAAEVFHEVGANIGTGLANIVNGLSPELVVIGGSIAEYRQYVSAAIQHAFAEQALSLFRSRVRIEYGKLGSLASVYGLSSLVFVENLPTLIQDAVS